MNYMQRNALCLKVTDKAMCPVCGSQQRLGVWLPRKKVPIFDRIQRAGIAGVSTQALAERLGTNTENITMHVHQINIILAETDWIIRGADSRYRLIKR